MCLLRTNTADQMLENFFPAFPALGVKLDDIVVVNFAMWMNTYAALHPAYQKYQLRNPHCQQPLPQRPSISRLAWRLRAHGWHALWFLLVRQGA